MNRRIVLCRKSIPIFAAMLSDQDLARTERLRPLHRHPAKLPGHHHPAVGIDIDLAHAVLNAAHDLLVPSSPMDETPAARRDLKFATWLRGGARRPEASRSQSLSSSPSHRPP
ncbi:hypothetical protein J1C48_13830 [Jiella sp. CQZ9-1]|uniref:Uncharacterized protein n=1 Tax=Jiella flava TaxID=2816857 RepID=A0A939JWM3_9HYPH|nr:hypothetical protein [Jiella flava]